MARQANSNVSREPHKNPAVRRARGSIALSVLAGWLCLTPLGEGLRHLSYELPFLVRPSVVSKEAVILYMDDESHSRLQQPWMQEWDRRKHAELLDALAACKAQAVVLDALFDERTVDSHDQALLEAAARHGKVVFVGKVTPHVYEGEVIGAKILQPFTNTIPWGVTEHAGTDRFIRQHFRSRLQHEPSVAWVTAQLTMTNPPTNPDAPRWMNYYGPPGTLPSFSYFEVLENKPNVAAALSNKVVFVGALYSTGFSGGMGTDDFRTPYTRWSGTKSPGVEITATAYLNLRRNDWLVELPRPFAFLLLAMTGTVFGLGSARLRPMRAVAWALGLAAAIAVLGMTLVWLTEVWWPWLAVVAVQIPMALGWTALTHTRTLEREKENLAERLAASQAATKRTVPLTVAVAAHAHAADQYAATPPFNPPGTDLLATPPIADHELLQAVGRGAYGEVWLARDAIGSYHAVKIIHRQSFQEDAPFEREFRGIQKFTPISRSHPGFVHVLHVGRNDAAGYFYYIMELGDDVESGPNIRPEAYVPQNLARALRQRGRFPASEAVQLGIVLSSALDQLHQHQLIHRDIKPSNIIFVNGAPKLADIGLVTDLQCTGQDVTFLGTAGYIAPEGPGTAAADVFSLGKVLYEVSTGQEVKRFPEWPGSWLDRTQDGLLLQLNRVIMKACEPDPRRRYRSAGDLRVALEQLQTRRPRRWRFWASK